MPAGGMTTMRNRIRKLVFPMSLMIGVVLSASPLQAQSSRCADCHFANPDAPAADHLDHWDRSAHEHNGVGCEMCHRGNASTFEPFLAHQGILNSRNPASPTHWKNLPETCGACHIEALVAFGESKHYQLLQEDSREAPTCSTCHGSVGAHLLSPKRLAKQCERCHGEGKIDYKIEYPILVKLLMEQVGVVREQLDHAEHLVHRVKDEPRRQRLEEAYRQAEVPLIAAVQSGHSFVFDELQDFLNLARQRVGALLEELANPSAGP